MKITISAQNHNRTLCPVSFTLPAAALPVGKGYALALEGGRTLPLAAKLSGENAEMTFILDWLGAGEEISGEIIAAENTKKMHITADGKGILILCGDKPVTRYYTAADIPKPHLGHFRDEYGTEITRIDPDIKEHPHHRALWISHGDVNGVDTWNENPDHGYIRNQDIRDKFESDVYTSFTAENLWTDHSGAPLCTETTNFKIYATPARYTVIDLEICLSATHGDVTLGATKEAGPLAVRMAEDLRVVVSGTMESAEGGINEGEIWMKRSAWVDYSGTKNGRKMGIAIFDNAENELFPTYWHARNYGLMAVNNFYRGGPRKIPAGQSKSWRFRVVAHSGSTNDADIKGKYLDYFAPVKVTVE